MFSSWRLRRNRVVIEKWLIAAFEAGWELGDSGLPKPSPEFDWSEGIPLIKQLYKEGT